MNQEKFVSDINRSITNNYDKYSEYLDVELDWPEYRYVIHEIARCLIMECYQAAITLTNHLLENITKLGLVYHSSGGKQILQEDGNVYDYPSEIAKWDKATLEKKLSTLKEKSIISENTYNQLDKFRNLYRNSFGHANGSKTFGDIMVPFGPIQKVGTNHYQLQRHKIAHVPAIQGMAQQIIAEGEAGPYFGGVYLAAIEIMKNVEGGKSNESETLRH